MLIPPLFQLRGCFSLHVLASPNSCAEVVLQWSLSFTLLFPPFRHAKNHTDTTFRFRALLSQRTRELFIIRGDWVFITID